MIGPCGSRLVLKYKTKNNMIYGTRIIILKTQAHYNTPAVDIIIIILYSFKKR